MNMNHFNSVMHNNIKLSKQKERMLEKLRKRKEERERMQQQNAQPQEFTHSVFKGEEKMEKSKRGNNKKKKKRRKKKEEGVNNKK